MKKVLTILLTILLIFAVGCAVQEKVNETPAHVVEANHDVADTDEPEAPRVSVSAAERVSLTYDSVEKMIEAIQTERQAKSKDGMAQVNELEALSVVYVPAESLSGRRLQQIEVSPYAVFYYYMPGGTAAAEFSDTEGIIVSCYREPEYNPDTFFADNGLIPDEDGFVYEEEKNKMTFIQDDGIISVRVPDNLNNYETLRNLCEVEKIEIP